MQMDFPTLILSLLGDGWLFFNEDEIVWDGEHHKIVGIQVNLAKMDELMNFVSQHSDLDDIQETVNYLIGFLAELEKDEAFRIKRGKIAQGVRKALREGDMTGITFANLASCSGAFRIQLSADDEYVCLYDTRLSMGVPHFFDLIARLLWDFRSFMKSQKGVPFTIVFMSARNFDADAYLGSVSKEVEGCQANPGAMRVDSIPSIGAVVTSLLERETPPQNAPEDESRADAGKSQNDVAKPDVSTDAVQKEDAPRAVEAWRASSLLSTAVEAALEELRHCRVGEYVGNGFVSQSEKIIGSILSQQQAEADYIARKRYESGEDIKLLLSLHEELGHVLCHVLGAYLDCVEGTCKAGCDSDSLKTMLAEVQEVVDLIKQDPSITDSKLGKVRIGKARIPAEFKKLDARRKELKKKVDELKRQEVASRKEERRKQKVEKLEKRLTRERRSLEKIHYGFQEQELAGLEIKAKVAGSRIADLQMERDSLGLLKFAKKRELSDKIEAQQRDLEKLKAKIAPLRAEVEESRQRESRLRTSIADLERELAEFRGDDGE